MNLQMIKDFERVQREAIASLAKLGIKAAPAKVKLPAKGATTKELRDAADTLSAHTTALVAKLRKATDSKAKPTSN